MVYEIEEAETKIGRKESCDIVRAALRLLAARPSAACWRRPARHPRHLSPCDANVRGGRHC